MSDVPRAAVSERPPQLLFQLLWASPEEKAAILEKLRRLERQTMNLRVMPSARILALKTQSDGSIVAWGGVDVDADPKRPELFSLHVEESYRTYTLGLVIELGRYLWVKKQGHSVAYARMDAASNFSLLRYRITNNLYRMIPREEVDPDWARMCTQCELYGRQCASQAFFAVDVDNFIEHAIRRIGAMDIDHLPRPFELRKERLRTSARPLHPALPGVGEKPYKPYWT